MDKKFAVIYQYIVLTAVVGFLGWGFFVNNEWNEILLGALIGVMVMLPIKDKKEGDQ